MRAGLITPEILEARRGQFGVSDGMLNVAVAEVGLQGTGVVALVGQGITASVPMSGTPSPEKPVKSDN